MITHLKAKIVDREANISVIGLGHIGLPLAVRFAEERFRVTGIDNNDGKLNQILNCRFPVAEVPCDKLRDLIGNHSLRVTGDYSALSKVDIIIICVPTPLNPQGTPDLQLIREVLQKLTEHLQKGQLVVLESTVYPGFTENELVPKLQKKGMRIDDDVFVAYSPNRINPADPNPKHLLKMIPKVISGTGSHSSELIKSLYDIVFDEVEPAPSTTVAEMSKLWENIYRFVNIALANETARTCDAMGIDFWEVCRLAATKPFGFEKYDPGPGIGGHCIPIDPHYFSSMASKQGFATRLIDQAKTITEETPKYVVSKTTEILEARKKSIQGSKILLLGVAYKKNVNDARTSPALHIVRVLKKLQADVCYHDPHVPMLKNEEFTLENQDFGRGLLKGLDCIIVLTDHNEFEDLYPQVIRTGLPIIDTRNALQNSCAENIIRLYSGTIATPNDQLS